MSPVRRLHPVALVAAAWLAAAPGPVLAQAVPTTVHGLAQALFRNEPTPAEVNAGLVRTVTESGARFPEEIAKLLSVGLSSIPLSSSSAGFTYVHDPVTGEASLKASSFGPLFVERPLTNGQGVFNFGISYQRLTFDRLFDQDIGEDGVFIFDNRGIFPDGLRQVVEERATFKADISTYAMTASYGVSRFVDLAVSVPFVSIDASGSRIRSWDVPRSFAEDPAVRAELGTPTGSRPIGFGEAEVSASGVGDIALRAKVALGPERTQPVALVADLRLPTGDEENLLGAGKAAAKFSLVAGRQWGAVSAYGSTGVSTGGLVTAFDYAGAVDVAVGPRKQVTLAMAFFGQTTSEGADLSVSRTLDTTNVNGIRTTFDRNIVTDARLTTGSFAPSARVQLTNSLLLSAAVLVPVGKSGFQSGVSPTIGLDYTFGNR